LSTLFRSNDDLYVFLANYNYSRASDVVGALPATSVPKNKFMMGAVQQLQAHGLDTEQLFVSLADQFPAQRESVEAAKDAYLANAAIPDRTDDGEQPPPELGGLRTADLTSKFEKVMGGRPTFLDVSYLAVGYERTKSVAKLRMCFSRQWFAGTAFLVSADTLLTAHHNLWTGKQRADAVEVIFDYERSTQGPDPESTLYRPDPESFVGSAEDDWALLKLNQPQAMRPLAPFATKEVRVGDRVAIIQHPKGMPKQVALHHNLVTYVSESRVQYLTDTEPGSSGSPVFDDDWNVVAVHHKGGLLELPGTQQSVYRNQGVPIQRVLAGLADRSIKL
jgi:V8-like Glu-specific endopeptidase